MLRVFLKLLFSTTIYLIVMVVFFIPTVVNGQQGAKYNANKLSRKTSDTLSHSAWSVRASDTLRRIGNHKLIDTTNKPYIVRQLYGLVVRGDALKTQGKVMRKFKPDAKFAKHANKRIVEIRILRLKAFGQSVHDTLMEPSVFLEKFGNSLHVPTSKIVIENNLLFKEGDLLKPVNMAETEQLLRDLSFIEDANIIVQPLRNSRNVRIIVVTKDRWTLSGGLRISGVDKGSAYLSERNIGGFGIGAKATGYFDNGFPDPWGFKGEVEVSNIAGSFINSNLWVREGLGYYSYYGGINRDFFASKTKYAGGLSYLTSQEPYGVFAEDTTISIDYNVFDCWLGRSFRLSGRDLISAPYNLTLAAKYRRIEFDKADVITATYNPYFHSTHQYLFALGLSNQTFFQSNLIYSFGATEDIPVGFKAQFSTGFEKSQFSKRVLLGGEMAAAEITPLGDLYISFRAGGYLANRSKIEQALINIRTTYITNLFALGRYDIRQFVKCDFTRGISRFSGEREYVALQSNYGVRGLKSNLLTGETRLMVNLETVAFTPLYVYGFRFAYFLFCDLGFIGSADSFVYSNPMYSGFGIGLRVKNESLIFPSFLFRLGYYPRLPSDGEASYWLISTERRNRFEQFRMREPSIMPFD